MSDPRMIAMKKAMGADHMGWTEREKTCFTLGYEAARRAVPAQARAPDDTPFCYMTEGYDVALFHEAPTHEAWADFFPVYRAAPSARTLPSTKKLDELWNETGNLPVGDAERLRAYAVAAIMEASSAPAEAPSVRDQVMWDAALEAAAKLMDPYSEADTIGALNAAAIRALQGKPEALSGFRIIVDPAMPPDTMRVTSGENSVMAVNIGNPEAAKDDKP